MIVRIATEGQYRLPDDAEGELNELDNATVAACEGGEEAAFRAAFGKLLDFVRTRGEPLGDDELEESQVIVPPPDTTLAEASADFSGEGLIPG